jgi:hypothetical protein
MKLKIVTKTTVPCDHNQHATVDLGLLTDPDDPSIRLRKIECQEVCANRKFHDEHSVDITKLSCKGKVVLKDHFVHRIRLPKWISQESSSATETTDNGEHHTGNTDHLLYGVSRDLIGSCLTHTAPRIISQSLHANHGDTLHRTRTLHIVKNALRKIIKADITISSRYLVGSCAESAISNAGRPYAGAQREL